MLECGFSLSFFKFLYLKKELFIVFKKRERQIDREKGKIRKERNKDPEVSTKKVTLEMTGKLNSTSLWIYIEKVDFSCPDLSIPTLDD